jgi:hypothetical protein
VCKEVSEWVREKCVLLFFLVVNPSSVSSFEVNGKKNAVCAMYIQKQARSRRETIDFIIFLLIITSTLYISLSHTLSVQYSLHLVHREAHYIEYRGKKIKFQKFKIFFALSLFFSSFPQQQNANDGKKSSDYDTNLKRFFERYFFIHII